MEALPDGASLRLIHNGCKSDAPPCEAEADSGCVLVSAAGTPTRHLYVCVCLHGAAMLQGLAGLGFAFSDTRLSVAVAEEEGFGWARSHLHW